MVQLIDIEISEMNYDFHNVIYMMGNLYMKNCTIKNVNT